MSYAIHFVGDEALLEGQDFLMVKTPDGALIFYKESALSPALLEASWAAFRAVVDLDGDTPRDPARAPLRNPHEDFPRLTLVS